MAKEPIIEFKDEAQAYECLEEWQARLFLNDWIIKLRLIPLSEMCTIGHLAENEYQTTNRGSFISIGILTESAKNCICKESHECVLVHELLHLKLTFTDGAPETTEGQFLGGAEHTLIEQMAKSLIMAKYDLPFDWFKNF